MNINDCSEIEYDFYRISELFSTDIFNFENQNEVFRKSAFIEVLICLRNLMYKTESFDSRISFTDDVIVKGAVKDITNLIKYVRDALCHPDSQNHKLGSGKFSFNIFYGKYQSIFNGIELISEYEDDYCYFFGEQKIYFKRHIIRALSEAFSKLNPLVEETYAKYYYNIESSKSIQ